MLEHPPRIPHVRWESAIPDRVRQCCSKGSSNCGACRRLVEVDGKIEETRRALELLLEERESLTPFLNQHHDPFTQHLPVKVVSRIFGHCRIYSPSKRVLEHIDRAQHLKSLFLLTHVCQRWRSIAHCTPELWTIVPLFLQQGTASVTNHLIEEWLKRSGVLPLFVLIRAYRYSGEKQDHHFQPAIAAICRQAHRWQYLDLSGPRRLLRWVTSTAFALELNTLERIELSLLEEARENQSESRQLQLKAAPRYLGIDGGKPDLVSVDLSNLREFRAWDERCMLGIGDCVRLFRESPKLASCYFSAVDAEHGTMQGESPLQAVALQELFTTGTPDIFWEQFDFPYLRTLHIDELSDFATPAPIHRFLSRSASHLQDLVIHDYTPVLQEDDIVQIIVRLPRLQRLDITGCVVTTHLFSLLHVSARSSEAVATFPCLESFVCSAPAHISWDSPVSFLQSMRLRSKPLLRKFHYECYALDAAKTIQTFVDISTLARLIDFRNDPDVDFRMTSLSKENLLDILVNYYERE